MKIETFLKRAVGKVNAYTFLHKHKDYLCTFPRIVPVLVRMEKNELFPTQALNEVVSLIAMEKDPLETVEVVNKKTGEVKNKKVSVLEKVGKKREVKKYQLFLFAKSYGGGNEVVAIYDAVDFGAALTISYRKLFQREDSVYLDIIGLGVTTRVSRDDAIREILGRGRGHSMVCQKARKNASISWGGKVKNYVATFSKG